MKKKFQNCESHVGKWEMWESAKNTPLYIEIIFFKKEIYLYMGRKSFPPLSHLFPSVSHLNGNFPPMWETQYVEKKEKNPGYSRISGGGLCEKNKSFPLSHFPTYIYGFI